MIRRYGSHRGNPFAAPGYPEPIRDPDPDVSQHGQTRDLTAGQQTSVLRWRSRDRGAEQVSLHLGIVMREPPELGPQDPTPRPTPIVQAELRWGIGGTTHTALVDYMLGATVALAASEVEVIARYVNTSPIAVQVTASLSRNIKSNNNVPSALLTQHLGQIYPDDTVHARVPSWATVGIVVFAPMTGSLTLSGYDAGRSNGGAPGRLWEQRVLGNGDTFPVVSGQTGIAITNGPTTLESVALQYALVF
jgi:hypothetical protein